MAKQRIFLYGSLRMGEHNNKFFMPDSAYVGTGVVANQSFELWGSGAVPAASIHPNGGTLEGEVWACPERDYESVRGLELGAGYEEIEVIVALYKKSGVTSVPCLMYTHEPFGVQQGPDEDGTLVWPRRKRG